MKTLTHSSLLTKISTAKGALIIGIEALTDAKARKTGNPFGAIFKHSRSVGFVGASYEKAVNREGERQDVETNFKAAARPWGEWVVLNKVATHKGEFYLRTQSTPGQRKRQRAKLLAYKTENGSILAREDVAPFLPEKPVSVKQYEAGLDVGEQIEVREFKFSSIQKVRLHGETFKLIKG